MSQGPHILIVEARFYTDITDDLLRGARAVLEAASATFERVSVPGSFEVPAAIRFALDNGSRDGRLYDGVIALGCVIRGETDHYDHICRETSRALMDFAVRDGLALGFGILTCDTREQARVRAAPEEKDKGADAARACLAMVDLRGRVTLPYR